MPTLKRDWKFLVRAVIVLAVLVVLRGVTQAQPQELLQNPNFESYVGTGGGNVVPANWTLTSNVPVRSARQNWVFNEFPPFTGSWQVETSGYPFTMTAYQFVPGVRSGTRLRFSAYANVFTCDRDNSCIDGAVGYRLSMQESGARTRIGVDPQGGTDPNAASVLWSQFISPFDRFEQMILDFQSQNDNGVTVFLYATQNVGMLLNHVYWNNASLQLLGAAGPGLPVATEIPRVVPYVTPQGRQPDGSIVHVVSSGDTLSSIAVAYRVTVQHIRELNNIPPAEYVLQIGQRLLIQTPPPPAVTYIIVTATPTMDPFGPTWTPTPTATPTRTPTRRAGIVSTPRVIMITLTTRTPTPTATPTPNTGAYLAPPAAEPDAFALRPVRANEPSDIRASKTLARMRIPVPDCVGQPANGATGSTICVLAFEDTNANRFRDADEALLAGMTLSLSQRDRAAISQITNREGPTCFRNLQPGPYSMTADPPPGHGLTTPAQLRVVLSPGAQLGLSFGAAPGHRADTVMATGASDVPDSQRVQAGMPAWLSMALDNSGIIVLVLAGMVLLGGLGLALALRRY